MSLGANFVRGGLEYVVLDETDTHYYVKITKNNNFEEDNKHVQPEEEEALCNAAVKKRKRFGKQMLPKDEAPKLMQNMLDKFGIAKHTIEAERELVPEFSVYTNVCLGAKLLLDYTYHQNDNVNLPIVGFANKKKTGVVLYNRYGLDITPNEMNEDIMDEVKYVVMLHNGVVLSMNHETLFVASYDEDNSTKFAPGSVISFDFCQDDKTLSGLQVCLKWLPTDKEYDVQLNNLYDTVEASLPIETVLGSAYHIPSDVKAALLTDYRCVTHQWEQQNPQLTKQCRTDSVPFCDNVDLYDLLELYHVRNNWVWRTALARYIFQTFVHPFKNFGLRSDESNFTLIGQLAWNEHTSIRHLEFHERKDTCDACRLKRCALYEWRQVYYIGSECHKKLEYLHEVFKIMHGFRALVSFQPKRGFEMVSRLREEREKFISLQDTHSS